MDKAPERAEKFTRSDFVEYKSEQSKILPGRTVATTEICRCPRCERQFGRPWEHGETNHCTRCNLFILTFGNSIFIWEHP